MDILQNYSQNFSTIPPGVHEIWLNAAGIANEVKGTSLDLHSTFQNTINSKQFNKSSVNNTIKRHMRQSNRIKLNEYSEIKDQKYSFIALTR